MIIGIGADLCDIGRIERVLARFGSRFLDRVFTKAERGLADGHGERAAAYAKRFAAKEACAKALGTGVADGVFLKDIGVVNLRSGAPGLALANGARARLGALTPAGHEAVIHVSLTDERPSAMAFVVIEARPLGR